MDILPPKAAKNPERNTVQTFMVMIRSHVGERALWGSI